MKDSDFVKALKDMKLKYPEGEVTNYFPDKGYGFITNDKGEKIFFFLPEVDTMGCRTETFARDSVTMCHLAKGRRISRMKILRQASPEGLDSAPSER